MPARSAAGADAQLRCDPSHRSFFPPTRWSAQEGRVVAANGRLRSRRRTTAAWLRTPYRHDLTAWLRFVAPPVGGYTLLITRVSTLGSSRIKPRYSPRITHQLSRVATQNIERIYGRTQHK